MEGWIDGMQASLDYIEEHLDDTLTIEDVARTAGLSPFYYQRIFGALCGITAGEYIRARRMTLAAQELAARDAKVIDLAVKYGYESPESFARAFQRFHGVTPARAREKGTALRSLSPLHIRLSLEGKNMLDYQILEKAPFTLVGVKRRFRAENSYQEIPKFWAEWAQNGGPGMGMFGLCMDGDGREFDYWIADLYEPWEEIPAGCETVVIPGGLWAQFPCRGPLPESLQTVNTQIWAEWLPGLKGYELAGNYNLEVYTPPAEKPEDTLSYIWIPLKKQEN